MSIRLAILSIVLAVAGCGDNDPAQPRSAEEGAYFVQYTPEGGEIPLNQPFSLTVEVLENGNPLEIGRDVSIDARMPEHGHGMNVEPTVSATGEGTFRAEGMLFHMPGRWVLTVYVPGAGVVTPVDFEIMLTP